MKIAVDVMGFENNILEAINACEKFLTLHNDLEIVLVGNKYEISKLLSNNSKLLVEHADEFVDQNDTIFSLRTKKNSSMQIAANLLNNNKVDGLLSAGNTSIFVFIMYSTIGLIDGINKLGFMPCIPTSKKNKIFNMIDVGASIEVTANDLVKFAIMANIFAKQRVNSPKIGVLNIGTEKHKGYSIHQEVDKLLLNQKKLNYIGFIESRDLLNYVVDIVVTDAFSGNLVLKAYEGAFKTISNVLKEQYKKPKNFLAALFNYKILKNLKDTFDYKNNAGAIVLGLNKPCVKTHGSADEQQFFSSLKMLYDCIKFDIINKIKNEIKRYEYKK